MYDFTADEGVDKQIVDSLRFTGFSVLYIAEDYSGINDEQVLEISNQDKSLPLTEDKDFGTGRNFVAARPCSLGN